MVTYSKYGDTVGLKLMTAPTVVFLDVIMNNSDKGSNLTLEEVESFYLDPFIGCKDGII